MQFGQSIGAVAIGVLSCLASGAGAQDMLDQQFEGIAAIGIGNVSSLTDRAQTFTVGLSGQLTRIELSISKAAVAMDGDVLQVDIYPTNAMDVPVEDEMQSLGGTTVLGSELSTTLVPLDMHEVSLTGENIMVTNGEVLAIVLRSTV